MSTTPKPTFEFCAYRYLVQWLRDEQYLHQTLSSKPTPDDIRDALRYFQVARTFRNLAKIQISQLVLELFDNAEKQQSLTPTQKVVALASEFRNSFGSYNISAASKLFWLKHRTPYIIYDSRAARSLRAMGCTFENGNYTQYSDCWREQFYKREKSLSFAASRLNEIRPFLPNWHDPEEYLKSIPGEPWFLERVFDIYLWENGG